MQVSVEAAVGAGREGIGEPQVPTLGMEVMLSMETRFGWVHSEPH